MRGGLGDVKVKKFLNNVIQDELRPIRERRKRDRKKTFQLYTRSWKREASRQKRKQHRPLQR